ncbi:MAG: OsmC family protein [Mobilibacterium timonense]|uniref:OsmC family protein n=1 Tax=Mobilibacterium timonense TaxID=1871012 RepID=UPI0009875909|nr:OsmC family protein [Mobilibacterium timonense]MBM6991206.1 OsmC family protein [Mobilibacterium timonense]
MISTFNAKVSRLSEGLQVEAQSRGFKVIMDEPVEGGGTDKGMNPVELLLSAYGGCLTILAAMMAPGYEVDLGDCYAELEGDLDLDEGSEYNGFQEIRVTFHVKSSSPKENVKNLIQGVEAGCPIGNTLRGKVNIKFNDIVFE